MKEALIQKAILSYLQMQEGYFVWRNYLGPVLQAGGRRVANPLKGMPDLMGFDSRNRCFAIEVKAEKGVLSKEQQDWIGKLRAKGVIVIVARSLQEVIDALR